MIRVSMFYPHTPEMHFDLDYFLTRHVPLMESLLTPEGLLHVEVDRGLAMSDPALPVQFAVIAYLTFHGYEEMQTAMGTQ